MLKFSKTFKNPTTKAYLLLGFCCFYNIILFGQNSSKTDSLETVYINNSFVEKDRLKILINLALNHPNPNSAILYSDELIVTAQDLDSLNYLFRGFLYKGHALRLKGDLSNALENYFVSAKLAGEAKKNRQVGIVSITIADVYSLMGNHQNAIKHYNNAIEILRREQDSLLIASALLNAGDEYLKREKLNDAIKYFQEAGIIFKKLNNSIGYAYYLGNMGLIYAKQGNDNIATKTIEDAVSILETEQDFYGVSAYLGYMSEIYALKDDWNSALKFAKQSLEIAHKYGLKKEISDAYLQLSEMYEQLGDLEQYIAYYKNHIIYKDSINNITTVQQIANIRTDYEVSEKQIEVDLLNEQKKNQQNIGAVIFVVLLLVIALSIGLYKRYKYIQKTKLIIEQEKNMSENLLLNILPEHTAQELKNSGRVKAKKFESVTVLFTDFKNFTQVSENLDPEELVENVDYYFSKFDAIIEKHHLEKIKTIGDSYMCAGGLPFETKDHAKKMILAAFDIITIVNAIKKDETKLAFDIRVGINSGPVVAGVVGTKKFAYDVWGDTVNIASRMESNSEPGKINVSESTYKLVKDEFNFTYRGEVNAKNKGMLKMFFVEKQ